MCAFRVAFIDLIQINLARIFRTWIGHWYYFFKMTRRKLSIAGNRHVVGMAATIYAQLYFRIFSFRRESTLVSSLFRFGGCTRLFNNVDSRISFTRRVDSCKIGRYFIAVLEILWFRGLCIMLNGISFPFGFVSYVSLNSMVGMLTEMRLAAVLRFSG